jgi:PHD/YefM family antitoxin component YafN of YafNO toxin-antitoxin module
MQMETLDISEARRKLTRLDSELRRKKLIWITRHGKRAFAVVNREVMEALLETIEILQDEESGRLLQESLADIRSGKVIDHEALQREMETWPLR